MMQHLLLDLETHTEISTENHEKICSVNNNGSSYRSKKSQKMKWRTMANDCNKTYL